jgi:hypothetical protein
MIHAGEAAGLYINSGGTRVIVRICSTLIVEIRSDVVFSNFLHVHL